MTSYDISSLGTCFWSFLSHHKLDFVILLGDCLLFLICSGQPTIRMQHHLFIASSLIHRYPSHLVYRPRKLELCMTLRTVLRAWSALRLMLVSLRDGRQYRRMTRPFVKSFVATSLLTMFSYHSFTRTISYTIWSVVNNVFAPPYSLILF